MPLSEDVRRVVTTVDETGKAVVLFDGDNPHKVVRPNRSVPRLVWVTDETPADINGPADRAAVSVGDPPPARRLDLPHCRHPADHRRRSSHGEGLPA